MELSFELVEARHPAARAGRAAALRRVSLQVGRGEQLAVIGPSGAGKTTLLHVAAAALPPARGQVRIGGLDPWAIGRGRLRALRARLFLAPHVPPLPPRQRVVTSVLAGRLPAMSVLQSLRSLFYPIGIDQAHDALARFDLADKLFDRVDRLSGGERQRVGLARALLSPASLWLVDEPLSALDSARAAGAIAALTEHARTQGRTLIATLHDVSMALGHFGRIVGLRAGEVAFDLPPQDVTPALLQQLYAQHEGELHPQAPTADEPASVAPTRVVACR